MVAATKEAASHQSRFITQAISSSHQQLSSTASAPCTARERERGRERERERETSSAQLFARRETSSPQPITNCHRLHHTASPSTAGSLSATRVARPSPPSTASDGYSGVDKPTASQREAASTSLQRVRREGLSRSSVGHRAGIVCVRSRIAVEHRAIGCSRRSSGIRVRSR